MWLTRIRRPQVVLCLVAQSCLNLCDPMDSSPPGSSVHGDSSGKKTGIGSHALLQRIFPTQGLNPGLPQCRQILYHLSHQGSPDHKLKDPYSDISKRADINTRLLCMRVDSCDVQEDRQLGHRPLPCPVLARPHHLG